MTDKKSTNPKHEWDQRYTMVAKIVASWSKDPSTQCGAIIVRKNKTLASAGYNGFPRGMIDLPERYQDRSYKYPHIIHSEWNAIQSSKDHDLSDCSVFAWPMPPCNECTNAIIQKNISRVVCPHPSADKLDRWRDSFDHAREQTRKSNILFEEINFSNPDLYIYPSHDKWVSRFLSLAKEICSWSKHPYDPRGAVIVRKDKTISSLGFSGFPSGLSDEPLMSGDRKLIDLSLIPAELNAILFSRDTDFYDMTCYSWPSSPSLRSVAHLFHNGIRRFVFPKNNISSDYEMVKSFALEMGVSLLEI